MLCVQAKPSRALAALQAEPESSLRLSFAMDDALEQPKVLPPSVSLENTEEDDGDEDEGPDWSSIPCAKPRT